MRRASGFFIVLEGIDGCGKTAIAELLSRWLKKLGKKVVVTQEPTNNGVVGKKIRAMLTGKKKMVSQIELQKLYIQDRKQHIKEVIAPRLRRGAIIICQRYALSTFVYGTASGVSYRALSDLHTSILKGAFIVPNITFVLDISPRAAMRRIYGRGAASEYFEKEEKLKKVRTQYRLLAGRKELGPAHIINAQPLPDKIVRAIRRLLTTAL